MKSWYKNVSHVISWKEVDSLKIEFSCHELEDIYMSIVWTLKFKNDNDLVRLRDKIANYIEKHCGESNKIYLKNKSVR